MKRSLGLFTGLIFYAFYCAGQTPLSISPSANDTADFPYWIEMMQDPSVNFYKVQRAFNLYWEHRPIIRGCGWKPFKRWEYMMQSRVFPDGTRPPADETYKAFLEFNNNERSSAGNWVSLGPSTIPAPGPAGYEGLGRLNAIGFHPTNANKIYVGSPSGGFWMSNDGGLTWTTTTDYQPTLGVSAILIDYSNANAILIGTGDRDASDAAGMGVFKSTDAGLTWNPSNAGMGNKTVGKLLQHPGNPLIFLAATSTGIYRSTDGGSSWTTSSTANFKDIAFKPNDPNIVYATASGNFYRSTDNGITFTKISSGLVTGQRGAIAVTQASPDYVYFLQSASNSGFQGLYRSTDAGLNFTTRSTTPNILDWSCTGNGTGGQGWYDLAVIANPNNASEIFAGGVDVWRSTDGGSTWTINSHWYGGCGVPAVHADCHILAYNPADGKLYAGNDGGLYFTTNSGTTWTDRSVGLTIGQIYKLGQSQTVKEKVINGFQDNGTYTYLSTGWVATGGGDGMECAVDWSNAAYTYHTIYYGDIYRRYNNSSEYHIAGNGTCGITESGAWITPFILHETDANTMFAGYKNIWRCQNIKSSPPSWTKISNNLAGSNSYNFSVLEQSPAQTNILYAVRSDKKLFRTDNSMTLSPTWTELSASLPVSGYTPTDIESHPTDTNTVYMTLNKKVYKSVNKGTSWTNITGNLPSINLNTIVYYANAIEGLYVGTDAGVYFKDQTMSTWIPFSQGLPVNGKITELEIYYDPVNALNDVIRASTYGRGLWSSDLYFPPTLERTWKGIISSDWDTPKNWFPLGVPSRSENVLIDGTVLINPVINTTGAQCNNLTISNNAILTINPLKTFTINGILKLLGPKSKIINIPEPLPDQNGK